MNILSTVSSKTQEFLDLSIGMVFVRSPHPDEPRNNHDNRPFVKINKSRACDLSNPGLYWSVPPTQLVKRVYIATDER